MKIESRKKSESLTTIGVDSCDGVASGIVTVEQGVDGGNVGVYSWWQRARVI
jgi:hypothetical protein